MSDNVKNPSHYNRGKIEVWEFIEDQGLDYHTGNAVKYIARAGYKDPSKEVEDLQKAIAFLERKIKVLTEKHEEELDKKFDEMLPKPCLDYLEWRYERILDFLQKKLSRNNGELTEFSKRLMLRVYYVGEEYRRLLPSSKQNEMLDEVASIMAGNGLL